ncbi:MAG: hypothetical protein AB8B64_18870 [Granulosicoccus sp.]
MRSSALTFFHALWFLCLSIPVFADEQRVLLSFDNAGHRVSQIVRPHSEKSLRQNVTASLARPLMQPDMDKLISLLAPGIAMLVWIDDEGNFHAGTNEPDPRISHAPNHIDGADGTKQGNISGAWLVSGPVAATRVTILLPSNPSLGLAYEQWQVSLTD